MSSRAETPRPDPAPWRAHPCWPRVPPGAESTGHTVQSKSLPNTTASLTPRVFLSSGRLFYSFWINCCKTGRTYSVSTAAVCPGPPRTADLGPALQQRRSPRLSPRAPPHGSRPWAPGHGCLGRPDARPAKPWPPAGGSSAGNARAAQACILLPSLLPGGQCVHPQGASPTLHTLLSAKSLTARTREERRRVGTQPWAPAPLRGRSGWKRHPVCPEAPPEAPP